MFFSSFSHSNKISYFVQLQLRKVTQRHNGNMFDMGGRCLRAVTPVYLNPGVSLVWLEMFSNVQAAWGVTVQKQTIFVQDASGWGKMGVLRPL